MVLQAFQSIGSVGKLVRAKKKKKSRLNLCSIFKLCKYDKMSIEQVELLSMSVMASSIDWSPHIGVRKLESANWSRLSVFSL